MNQENKDDATGFQNQVNDNATLICCIPENFPPINTYE
jgi:hypothetical protein